MPVSDALVDDIHVVRLEGEFRLEELVEAAVEMRTRIQGPVKIVIDARQSTTFLSHDFIFDLAKDWQPPKGSRYAIVVSKFRQYGVANIFFSYRHGDDVQVERFFDYDDAIRWMKS